MLTNKELTFKEGLELIKEQCKNKICENCPIVHWSGDGCAFDDFPGDWDIDEICEQVERLRNNDT